MVILKFEVLIYSVLFSQIALFVIYKMRFFLLLFFIGGKLLEPFFSLSRNFRRVTNKRNKI